MHSTERINMAGYYITLSMLFLFVTALVFVMGVQYGRDQRQQTIEDRALELPDPYEVDDTYSWGDIEYVVFGESQE